MDKQVSVDFMARTDKYDQGIKRMSNSTKGLKKDIHGTFSKPVGDPVKSSIAGMILKLAALAGTIKLVHSHWGLISSGAKRAAAAAGPHLQSLGKSVNNSGAASGFKQMVWNANQFGKAGKKAATDTIEPMTRLGKQMNSMAQTTAGQQMLRQFGPVGTVLSGLTFKGAALDMIMGKIGLGVAALGVGLGLALAGPAKLAIDVEKDMRNLNVVLQVSDERLGKLQERFGKMSTMKGSTSSTRELAQAAYDVGSTGFSNPTEVALVTEQAMRGAAAGMTDAKTAGSALLTVLSAYNLTAADSGRINDVLFKTVEVGRVTFEQLSLQIGDFIGIGRASGASVEELMAGYSNMTLSTGNSAKAATALNAVLRQMVTPSTELAALYKLWGYESGEAAIKGMGLQKTVERIRESTGGSSAALQKLIPDVEGMTGVFALTSRTSAEMNENIHKFTKEGGLMGATAEAMEEQGKSTAAELTRLKNVIIENATVIGKSLLPAIKWTAMAIAGFLGLFQSLPGWMQKSIGIVAGLSASFLVIAGTTMFLHGKVKSLVEGIKLLQAIKGANAWAEKLPFVGQAIGTINAKMSSMVSNNARLSAMVGSFNNLKMSLMKAGAAAAILAAGIYAGNKLGEKINQNRFGKVDSTDVRQMGIAFGNIDVNAVKAGKSTGTFAKEIDRLNAGSQDMGFVDNIKSIFGAYDKNESLTKSLRDIDKAAAEVVKSGNADKVRIGLELLAKAKGVNIDEITSKMPEYTVALEENALAAEVNLGMAKLQQDELDGTSNKTKMALAATESYTERIKELTKMTQDWLSLSKTMKGAEDLAKGRRDAAEAAKDATDANKDREEKEKDGIKTIADAEKDLGKERSEQGMKARRAAMAVAKARKDLNDLSKPQKREPGDEPEDMEQKALDRAQAELDLAEALEDQRNIGEGVAGAMDKVAEAKDRVKKSSEDAKAAVDAEKFSLADFSTALQAQLTSYTTFNANLEALARAGWQYEQIQQIKGMGEEGVELAAALAAAPAAEQDKVKGLLSQKMEAELAQSNRVLDLKLAETIAIARIGADATKQAILDEIAKIAPGIDLAAPGIQAAVARLGGAVPQTLAGVIGADVGSMPTGARPPEYSGMPNRGAYDSGGILKPGTTIALNKTGMNEYVFTAPQLQKVVSIARNTGGGGQVAVPQSQTTIVKIEEMRVQDFEQGRRQAEARARMSSMTGGGTR